MTLPAYSTTNPFARPAGPTRSGALPGGSTSTAYDEALELGNDLIARPLAGGGTARVLTQHSKGRMTVWERLKVLTREEPNILWHNWGPGLDGAAIVTAS